MDRRLRRTIGGIVILQQLSVDVKRPVDICEVKNNLVIVRTACCFCRRLRDIGWYTCDCDGFAVWFSGMFNALNAALSWGTSKNWRYHGNRELEGDINLANAYKSTNRLDNQLIREYGLNSGSSFREINKSDDSESRTPINASAALLTTSASLRSSFVIVCKRLRQNPATSRSTS